MAPASSATQTLNETGDGRVRLDPPFDELGLGHSADVTTGQAFDRDRHQRPQSSSHTRVAAAAFGFLVLIQVSERPETYREPSFFDTMPSQPSAQAFSTSRWARSVARCTNGKKIIRAPAIAKIPRSFSFHVYSLGARSRKTPARRSQPAQCKF